jgi:hypothetical protein
MVLIDSGSQIKVKPTASGTKYICGIDMCNTMVFDTVEVRWFPLAISNEQLAMSPFTVYPNPTFGGFYISNSNKSNQNLLVELLDMTGKKIFSQECSYKGIDCYFDANLSSGLYLVKVINTDNNETSLHKILFAK